MKTKHLFLSAALMLGVVTANAQTGNFGIGTATPTNKLHVKPTSVDPIRAEGLQTATDAEVITTDANGVLHKRTVASLMTSGTGTTGTSGYIQSCGCTNFYTLNATTNVVNGSTGNQTVGDLTAAQMATALNSGACDIAVSFPNSPNLTSGTFYTFALPDPSLYSGRTFAIHAALPLQVGFATNASSLQLRFINPTSGSYNYEVVANGQSASYYLSTQTGLTAGTVATSSSSGSAVPANTRRASSTLTLTSTGNSWTIDINSGCVVYRPQ